MTRCMAMVGGALLLVAAGCTPQSVRSPAAAPGYRQVVDAPLAEVSARLETGLREAGLSVLTARRKAEWRLAGQSKAGHVYCLHLRRETVPGGDRTVVTIVWDRRADPEFWRQVVEILTEEEEEADAP